MFRLIRWLVVPLAISAGLYSAADVTARKVAEDRLASAIGDQFEMKTDPKVSIHSFPFVWEALRRHRVTGAGIIAPRITIDALALENVAVDLEGITSPNFLSTNGVTVTVDHVSASARVTQAVLQRFITSRGIRVTIVLRDGVVSASARPVIAGRARTVTATGAVSIARTRLVFSPRTIRLGGAAVPASLATRARSAVGFSIPLPALPGDVRPTMVSIHPGSVTLLASGTHATVHFGGASRSPF